MASDLIINPSSLVSSSEHQITEDGKEIRLVRESVFQGDMKDQLFKTIEDRRHSSHKSAKLMYDFAKIILGTLIAGVTQIISSSSKKSE